MRPPPHFKLFKLLFIDILWKMKTIKFCEKQQFVYFMDYNFCEKQQFVYVYNKCIVARSVVKIPK